MKSSDALRADIDVVERERAEAAARLADLDATWAETLLSANDKKAEAHQAAVGKERRAVERAGLQLLRLHQELAEAMADEQAAARAEQQAVARQQVEAILDRAGEYREHAAALAAFVEDWREVQSQAAQVGIPGPEELMRSQETSPAQPHRVETESYSCFLDEFGREVFEEFSRTPSGFLTTDPKYRRERVSRTRETVVAREVPAQSRQLPPLANLINLPGLAAGDDAHWHADALQPKRPAAVALGRMVA